MSRIEEALRRANQVALEPAQSGAGGQVEPLTTRVQGRVAMGAVVENRSEAEAAEAVSSVNVPVAPAATDGFGPATHSIEHVAENNNEKLIVSEVAQPTAVEQYRKLAAALHQVQTARGTRIVMVASATVGEGKTLTSVNLALTLSESFRRQVLLVDADLRRPTVHDLFQISNASGLNDGLKADHDGKLALIEVSPRLTVLPAGGPNQDPMSGLSSERMRRIIEEASARFEWVVLDTPPVGLLPDANLLAEMVDMIVLVIGAGSTPLHLVQSAVKALNRDRIVGVVLNRVDESQGAYQYYDYATTRRDRPNVAPMSA